MLTYLSLLLLIGMAVTANQVIARQGRDGKVRAVPVAASAILYEGTLCYEDAGGDYTSVILEGGTFGGIVRDFVDNTGGADAAKTAEVWTDGDFPLTMDSASLVAADIGKPVYGVDNFTVSETATDRPPVGVIVGVISTTVALVSLHGLGERDTGPLVT
jgi:hypothetical protein